VGDGERKRAAGERQAVRDEMGAELRRSSPAPAASAAASTSQARVVFSRMAQ
jgi:hypothetical protein